jgi:DNA-binding protein Fis
MVSQAQEVYSLWEKLKLILHKYLEQYNGSFSEEAIKLILLFLESSLMDDKIYKVFSVVPSLRKIFLDLEQKVLRY